MTTVPCVAVLILTTVAQAPLAAPADRAAAELALAIGNYDPHATLADLVAASFADLHEFFTVAAVLREMQVPPA